MPDVNKADVIEEIDAHLSSQERKVDAVKDHLKNDALGTMFNDPDEAMVGLDTVLTGEIDEKHACQSTVLKAYENAAVDLNLADRDVVQGKLRRSDQREEAIQDIIDGMETHIDEEFAPESEAERKMMLTKAVVGQYPDMVGESKRGENQSLMGTSPEREAGKAARAAFANGENSALEDEITDLAVRQAAVQELSNKKSELESREGDTIPQDYAATVSEELGFGMGLDDAPSSDTPTR